MTKTSSLEKQPTLENRIASMLTNKEATSTDIETLLTEIDEAITKVTLLLSRPRKQP